MLDMSKELNCININKLIEDLRNTIETDVLHIISKLMSWVKFSKPTLEQRKEIVQAHLSLPTTSLKP